MDIVERLRQRVRTDVVGLSLPVTYFKDTLCQEAAQEIERLRGMLIFALDGLDDYWVTLPQGVELVNQIKALQQKDTE